MVIYYQALSDFISVMTRDTVLSIYLCVDIDITGKFGYMKWQVVVAQSGTGDTSSFML